MSIRIVQGNLLDAEEDIIVHQVNCQGVMGSGVARQIKEKWPRVFEHYMRMIKSVEKLSVPREKLLGEVCWDMVQEKIKDGGRDKWVASIFGQLDYNRNGERKLQTDYDALKKGFITVANSANWYNESVAMPYMIGCGRGGGDWSKVLEMIYEIFEPLENVDVVLYEHPGR